MHGGTSAMGLQLTPHRRRAPGGSGPDPRPLPSAAISRATAPRG